MTAAVEVLAPRCSEHKRCAYVLFVGGRQEHRPHSDTGAAPFSFGDHTLTWYLEGYPQQGSPVATITVPWSQVYELHDQDYLERLKF